MYQVYADNNLIYDSTLDDFKIAKGEVTLEVGKSGSFVFSVYPDHPYYSKFVQLKTVITVYKSGRIVFRGRVLNDVTDYWNNKTLTCEGELGFLNDSIIRPFTFEGPPQDLFKALIEEHNAQVDEFKRFKAGDVTIVDNNEYIARSNSAYESTQSNLTERLLESGLGGYFYVTHGAGGTDPIPTLHYVADFTKTSTQSIEFGVNLKDYTKTVKAEDIATAIIPLGAQVDDGDDNTENPRLTIESVNGGLDYVYDAEAVALRGWIFTTVVWEDVTVASNLKAKAESWLATGVNLATTIELTAIDLHLLDRSIKSFNVCEYVRVLSTPHGFSETMLCSKQTLDLLKPENDTVVLGYSYTSLTERSKKLAFSVSQLSRMTSELPGEVSSIKQYVNSITLEVVNSESTASIVLKAGETSISSQDIKMTGLVTITGLTSGTTTIDGACIKTGTISAERLDLKGAITFDDLSDDVANDINDAYSMAEDAEEAATAAEATVEAWCYTGTTKIDGRQIQTGTVWASVLMGGEIQLACAQTMLGEPVSSGGLFISPAATADYAIDLQSNGALRLLAKAGDLYLENTATSIRFSTEDSTIYCGSGVLPGSDKTYPLGNEWHRWSVLFADNGAIQTSDRNAKHDIELLPEKYIDLFDRLDVYRYKMNNGTSDRYHVGFVAQDVESDMDEAGIDSQEFGGFVKSQDAEGNDIYMLRYDEFIGILAAKIKQLDARVGELEGG